MCLWGGREGTQNRHRHRGQLTFQSDICQRYPSQQSKPKFCGTGHKHTHRGATKKRAKESTHLHTHTGLAGFSFPASQAPLTTLLSKRKPTSRRMEWTHNKQDRGERKTENFAVKSEDRNKSKKTKLCLIGRPLGSGCAVEHALRKLPNKLPPVALGLTWAVAFGRRSMSLSRSASEPLLTDSETVINNGQL